MPDQHETLDPRHNLTRYDFSKLKDLVEFVGKFILGFFALSYGVGLLVINSHLGKFGVYSLSIFRLSYVAAGLWALSPLIVIMFVGFSIYFSIKEYHISRTRTRSRIRPLIILILLLSIPLFATCILLLLSTPLSIVLLDWAWVWPTLFGIMFFWYVFVFVWVYTGNRLKQWTTPYIPIVLVVMIMVILFIYATIFGRYTYDKIPAFWGGGKPQIVMMVIKVDEQTLELLKRCGIKTMAAEVPNKVPQDEEAAHLLMNVRLVSVTEDSYIISGERVSATLARESVKSVAFGSIP